MSRATRVEALGALYSADATGNPPAAAGISARSHRLAEGAWSQREALDIQLNEAATGWRVERMPAVDRAVLRLALYELRNTTTPVGVVISEAVELAKQFSTQRSGGFVNGVLANLADVEENLVEQDSVDQDSVDQES